MIDTAYSRARLYALNRLYFVYRKYCSLLTLNTLTVPIKDAALTFI